MKTRTLRRYTPPTCTLEVMAAESALTRWAGQPVLKHLRFQLSFDDPRLPSDQRVLVRGDRTQLEALSETVETYVQQFLGDRTPPAAFRAQTDGLFLQPQGLFSHELGLGSLAAGSTQSTVRLSTLQLSDLAAALDEYAREAVALPTLNRGSGFVVAPAWLRTAAVILVTVGLTTTGVKLLDRRAEQMPTTASNSQAADNQLALEPPATVPDPLTVPLLPTPTVGFPAPTAGAAPRSPSFSLTPAPGSKPAPTQPQASSGRTQRANSPGTIAIPETSSKAGLDQVRIAPNPNNPLLLPPLPPAPVLIDPGQDAASQSQPSVASAPRAAQEATAANQSRAKQPASTAFDTLPQVAEVRAYFQQRWQPPQGLSQTLEYSLLLNSDGSLQRIVPLGQSAVTYIEQTGMPRAGEQFVSPVQTGPGLRIRLVLSPDGQVQTFQE